MAAGGSRWYKDGVPLSPGSKYGMLSEPRSGMLALVIRAAGCEDLGCYECEVSGMRGCIFLGGTAIDVTSAPEYSWPSPACSQLPGSHSCRTSFLAPIATGLPCLRIKYLAPVTCVHRPVLGSLWGPHVARYYCSALGALTLAVPAPPGPTQRLVLCVALFWLGTLPRGCTGKLGNFA